MRRVSAGSESDAAHSTAGTGRAGRQSHDYERHRSHVVICGDDVASGVTISTCTAAPHQEFLRFLDEIEANSSGFECICKDNYAPQGRQGARLANAAPAVSRSFHADQWQLAKSGGATVRRSDGTLRRRGSHTAVRALEKAMLTTWTGATRTRSPSSGLPMRI